MIQLGGEGLPTEKVRQGFLSLSGPSKELERLLLSDMFAHGGHPILDWCASNVAIEMDAAGNIKPSKSKSTERIDGIAALVTALALAMSEEAAEAEPEIIFL
jgi:phage terminase large subunit-like protein